MERRAARLVQLLDCGSHGLAALAIALLLAGCQARENAPPPGPTADSTAVREVLDRYYTAIEARDFRSAYALWSRGGAARRTGRRPRSSPQASR